MRKYMILVVIGMVFLLSGCSSSRYYSGKTPIEIEQYENPMVWRAVFQIQATLWPLEKQVNEMNKKVNEVEKNLNEINKKVNGAEKNLNEINKKVNEAEKNLNEMRDELATTKLSSIQAHKNIESLQAEIQLIKSESIRKERASGDMIRPAPEMQQEGFKAIDESVKKADELPIEIKINKEMPKMGTAKVEGESKKAGPDIQSIIINKIEYYKVSDTRDRVLIYVSAMNNPKLLMFKGEPPRIVLDFLNTRNIDKEKYDINTDGNFIKGILVRSYKTPVQKVRVFFDMMPNKKYSVEKKFSKKENMYSFDIKVK